MSLSKLNCWCLTGTPRRGLPIRSNFWQDRLPHLHMASTTTTVALQIALLGGTAAVSCAATYLVMTHLHGWRGWQAAATKGTHDAACGHQQHVCATPEPPYQAGTVQGGSAQHRQPFENSSSSNSNGCSSLFSPVNVRKRPDPFDTKPRTKCVPVLVHCGATASCLIHVSHATPCCLWPCCTILLHLSGSQTWCSRPLRHRAVESSMAPDDITGMRGSLRMLNLCVSVRACACPLVQPHVVG